MHSFDTPQIPSSEASIEEKIENWLKFYNKKDHNAITNIVRQSENLSDIVSLYLTDRNEKAVELLKLLLFWESHQHHLINKIIQLGLIKTEEQYDLLLTLLDYELSKFQRLSVELELSKLKDFRYKDGSTLQYQNISLSKHNKAEEN